MSVKQKFIDLVLRGKDLFSPTASAASDELKKLQAESKTTSEEMRKLEQAQAQVAKAQGLELFAKQAELALAGAREEVTRLAREMDASDRPTKEQSEALKLATRSASQLQTEYNKLQSQLSRSKTELQQSGVNTANLASEQDRLQREVKESANALNEKRTKLRELRSDMDTTEKSTGKFGEGLRGLTTRLAAFAAAYVGINQLRSALTAIFTTGDKFEKLDIQLTGIMGSIQAGEQASAWIKDFAKNTPLQLDQVTETFVRLKNFGLDPMDGAMQAIIDQSEKLGGGYERVQGISLALGQAWAKQKLQGEEILQLIERGVPVWQLLENVTGKNTAELQRLSSAGELGRDTIKQLIDEIGRSAEGSAAKGMSTLSGLVSNARDNFDQFFNLVATSGALDWLKNQLDSLNKTMAEMAASGELQELAKNISDGIVATAEAVKSLVTTIYEWRGAITAVGAVWATLKVGSFLADLSKGTLDAIRNLTVLVTTKKGVEIANGKLASSFGPLIGAIRGGIGAVSDWMKGLSGVGGLLAKGGIFAGIAYGVYEIGRLAKAWLDLREAERALNESRGEASITNSMVNEELAAINDQLNSNYTSLKEVIAAEEAGQIVREQSTGIWRRNTEEIGRNTDYLLGHGYALTDSITAIEEAYKSLGLQSTKSLEEAAEASRKAYEVIASGQEPIEQQRAAFLKYADAANKAAQATGESISDSIKATAANLGLTDSLDKLTGANSKSQVAATEQSKAMSGASAELAKTKSAIDDYRKTLDSTTASSEEKALAAQQLADAEASLTEQTRRLNEIKEVEAATYTKLQAKLAEYTQQMQALDELYKADGISAQEYIAQRERYAEVVGIIQRMLAGLGDGEQKVKEDTDSANLSLAEQQQRLDDLAESSGTATRYISLLANAQQALKTEFNLTDQTTEDLNKRLNELNGFIVQNNRVTNIWWRELAQASNEAFEREKLIIRETMAMRGYIQQLGSASLSMAELAQVTKAVDRGFTSLGDNDMAVLRQAITDAENRLLSFRDELEGTVSSLQDELDRLNDNQAAIEKRAYEQQTAELRAKLAAAQASGDAASIAAAKEALKLADQIYKTKQAQYAEELKANSKTTNTSSPSSAANNVTPLVRQTTPTSNTVLPTTTASSTRTVRLVLELQGQSYNADMSISAADQLLAQIERARSTSL
ncbi:tape measure protein [Alishewanella sp. SMS8]|uniref:tape measure protein n=1 Tax=Alishewanella sp. SMS8 TaxID=2994676 RepID=UPI002742498F|nr:tape measure protein [Alishewanella sp. SMS8]MDP5459891.1 tape measure protein [Alishewanella sp. SMS8]